MRRISFCLRAMLLLALVLTACGPRVSVKTAQDPDAKLSEYGSFAMLQPNKPIASENTRVDPFVMQRLRQLAYLRLKAKGYLPGQRDAADLLVSIHADEDTRYYSYSAPSYGYYSPYSPYYPRSGFSQEVWTIDESIVVVDLIDRRQEAVIWRGTGVRAKDGDYDEEELEEIISAILAEFPSRTGSPSSPTP